ncbi:Chloride conductance regulatory protein ICln-like protein [Drosera capensis]
MSLGLRPFTDRYPDCGRPILDATAGEELMHVQPAVSIVLGDRPAEAPGSLFITSRRVIWLSEVERSKGYEVDFLSISLHAVSRDPMAYPLPCIYAQIDNGDSEAEDEGSEGSESENELGSLDLSKIGEMRLVPSDPDQLDRLFEVFCECAELNPEPVEGEEEENSWIFSADQMEAQALDEHGAEWNFSVNHADSIGHSNGHRDLAQSVLQLEINDNRFEDAEEMEQDPTSTGHQ